jgi:hypothetical protein
VRDFRQVAFLVWWKFLFILHQIIAPKKTMNRERYLSESTEEAVQMRDKVKNLLYSKDNTNIELAYQIIKGGGMHLDFVPVLWAMNLSKGHRKRERNKIEKLVKEILSENAMLILRNLFVSTRVLGRLGRCLFDCSRRVGGIGGYASRACVVVDGFFADRREVCPEKRALAYRHYFEGVDKHRPK